TVGHGHSLPFKRGERWRTSLKDVR
ncbi:hypothetical protein CP08DC60_0408B, partial [Chlamydia psittaci 08DC60]